MWMSLIYLGSFLLFFYEWSSVEFLTEKELRANHRFLLLSLAIFYAIHFLRELWQ